MIGRLFRGRDEKNESDGIVADVDPSAVDGATLQSWCRQLLEEDEARAQAKRLAEVALVVENRSATGQLPVLDDDSLEAVIAVLVLRNGNSLVTRYALSAIVPAVQSPGSHAASIVAGALEETADSVLAGLSAAPSAQSPSPTDAFWAKHLTLDLVLALCHATPHPAAVVRPLVRSNAVSAICAILSSRESEALQSKCLVVVHALSRSLAATGTKFDNSAPPSMTHSRMVSEEPLPLMDVAMSPARRHALAEELAMLLGYGGAFPALLLIAEHHGGLDLRSPEQLEADGADDTGVALARAEDVRLCAETLRNLLRGNAQATKYFTDADDSLVPRLVCLLPRSSSSESASRGLEQQLAGLECDPAASAAMWTSTPDWLVTLECGLGILVECLDVKAAQQGGAELINKYITALAVRAPRIEEAVTSCFAATSSAAASSSRERVRYLSLAVMGAWLPHRAPVAANVATAVSALEQSAASLNALSTEPMAIAQCDAVPVCGTLLPSVMLSCTSAAAAVSLNDVTPDAARAVLKALRAFPAALLRLTASEHPSLPAVLAVFQHGRAVMALCRRLFAEVVGNALASAAAAVADVVAALTDASEPAASWACGLVRDLAAQAVAEGACFHRIDAQGTACVVAAHLVAITTAVHLQREWSTRADPAAHELSFEKTLLRTVRDCGRPVAVPADSPFATAAATGCSAVRYTLRLMCLVAAVCSVAISDGTDVRTEDEAERFAAWSRSLECVPSHLTEGPAAQVRRSRLTCATIGAAVARDSHAEGGRGVFTHAASCDDDAGRTQRMEDGAEASAQQRRGDNETLQLPVVLHPAAWCRMRRAHDHVARVRSSGDEADHSRHRSQSPVRAGDLDGEAIRHAPLFVPPPPALTARNGHRRDSEDDGDDVEDEPDTGRRELPSHVMPAAIIDESLWLDDQRHPGAQAAAAQGPAAIVCDATSLASMVATCARVASKAAREVSAQQQLARANERIAALEDALLEAQETGAQCARERDAALARVADFEADATTSQTSVSDFRRREAQLMALRDRVCVLPPAPKDG